MGWETTKYGICIEVNHKAENKKDKNRAGVPRHAVSAGL